MSTYIIGDLHGCLNPLERLLDRINYDPASDALWFVGDLINRGPASLQTLRYVKSLGDKTVVTLGNHDIHFLAVYNEVRDASHKDTLHALLSAPDIEELVDWLRHSPLLHYDDALNTVMVHAGIPPMWSLKKAQKQAKKAQKLLRAPNWDENLAYLFGNRPANWHNASGPRRRRRYTINGFTRMRYCWLNGAMDFSYNGQPARRPKNLCPWYSVPNRVPIKANIVFGHWAAHPSLAPPGIVPIDRGCVYGGSLVAYDVEAQECCWVNNR